MARRVQARELLVGVAGLALLRGLLDGTDEDAERRLAEVARVLADEQLARGEEVAEAGSAAGYAAWAGDYDAGDNPVVALEQPAVWAVLDGLPAGRALDAACGTGRHARHLAELGHDVAGADSSPAMLAVARHSMPGVPLVEADVRRLPWPDGHFGSVVCGLALAHVEDLERAVAELGRVLAPGGRLVVSVLHPVQVLLGWHAMYRDAGGARRFVREHAHSHARWLAAFRDAGLDVVGCVEPALTRQHARSKRRAHARLPEATEAAYAGLPGVLVWDAAKLRAG